MALNNTVYTTTKLNVSDTLDGSISTFKSALAQGTVDYNQINHSIHGGYTLLSTLVPAGDFQSVMTDVIKSDALFALDAGPIAALSTPAIATGTAIATLFWPSPTSSQSEIDWEEKILIKSIRLKIT